MAFNELRAIATFVKAAELGSLRQAALAQAITPQAASQALTQLESHLGIRLFHRTTRRLSLTEAGRLFLHDAQPGLATLQRALVGARRGQEEIAGPLRIVGPRATARRRASTSSRGIAAAAFARPTRARSCRGSSASATTSSRTRCPRPSRPTTSTSK